MYHLFSVTFLERPCRIVNGDFNFFYTFHDLVRISVLSAAVHQFVDHSSNASRPCPSSLLPFSLIRGEGSVPTVPHSLDRPSNWFRSAIKSRF